MTPEVTAEQFLAAVNEARDADLLLISRLREYAQELEAMLVEKRGNDAAATAVRSAYDDELSQLRYKLGLRAGLTIR